MYNNKNSEYNGYQRTFKQRTNTGCFEHSRPEGTFLEWKEDNSRNANSEDEYMTADEVAIKYHVSKTTLWRNVKNGVWPAPIKVGRKALYRKSDIDAVFNPSKQLPL